MHGCVGAFFLREINTKETLKTRKDKRRENSAKVAKGVLAFKITENL